MVGSLVFGLVAIGGFFLVPETGRGRARSRMSSAELPTPGTVA
jgi:hypothetical protein